MYPVDSVEKNSLRSREGRESSGWEHVCEAIGPGRYPAPGGGRTWWAHFEFTRINIEPIILKNKIEERWVVRAISSIRAPATSALAASVRTSNSVFFGRQQRQLRTKSHALGFAFSASAR
jgi:hypothetical protein